MTAKVSASHAVAVLVLVALALIVSASGAPLAGTAPARAADWEDVTCSLNGHPASTEGWTDRLLGTESKGASASNTCSSGGALIATDESRGETQSTGSGAEWDYAAAKGETIAGGSFTATVHAARGQAWVSMPLDTAETDLLLNCMFSTSCPAGAEVPLSKHGAGAVYAGAVCVGEEAEDICRLTDGIEAEMDLSSADILLSEDSRPTATEVTGSILEKGASGTATLSFQAADPEGPGVYSVAVKIDGDPIYTGTPDSNGGRCAAVGTAPEGSREFEAAQPCPVSVPISVQVPTGSFANGQHTLTVEVEDAAGVTATVYSDPITIANPLPASTSSSPAAPAAPPRGAPNGTPASEQATLSVSWGAGPKATPLAHLATSYGHGQAVTGTLTDSGGAPISGAAVEVSETAASLGASARLLTVVHTLADGTFTATLPATLTAGTVAFAYRSHLGDALPAATALLTVSMPAPVSLSVAPHVTRVHHIIHFTGRLSGPIPSGGKQVVIEARERGGSWVEFADPQTTPQGTFHAHHRMKYPGPAVYEFRAVCKHEADFPFGEGKSRIVSVRER